jgi:glutathione S-transferase
MAGALPAPTAVQINPCGQTPAFRDGELTLVRVSFKRAAAPCGARMTLDTRHAALSPRQTESGAIMLYLADKYGGAGPLGCDSPEKRAVLARWVC